MPWHLLEPMKVPPHIPTLKVVTQRVRPHIPVSPRLEQNQQSVQAA
jgi:hypothetical protein